MGFAVRLLDPGGVARSRSGSSAKAPRYGVHTRHPRILAEALRYFVMCMYTSLNNKIEDRRSLDNRYRMRLVVQNCSVSHGAIVRSRSNGHSTFWLSGERSCQLDACEAGIIG